MASVSTETSKVTQLTKGVINISVSATDIIADIRAHIAILAKRAHKATGQSMYSDLVPSTTEETIFSDMLMFGAENIITALSETTTAYYTKNGNTIGFKIDFSRWLNNTNPPDLTKAIADSITRYLYNFCISRFLSEIHPSTGEKYPPLWGQTYTEHCNTLLANIRALAFLKRPCNKCSYNYGNVGMKSIDGDILVTKPSGSVFLYTGSVIVFASDTNDYTVSGSTSGTNAGYYNVTYKLKANRKWRDGTTTDVTVTMTIREVYHVYYGVSPTEIDKLPYNYESRQLPLSGTLDITTKEADGMKCHWVAVKTSSGFGITKAVDSNDTDITSSLDNTIDGIYTIYQYVKATNIIGTTKFSINIISAD